MSENSPIKDALYTEIGRIGQDKINELYSQDKISLTQKSKMMNNLSSFQMLTKKEKRFFKLDTKEL